MTAACDVQHCKETFCKHLTGVDAFTEYNHVSSIGRKKCSFACYSTMLLLKNQKNILSLSETDTELTFPQEETSWCRVPCRPACNFCFLCFPTTSIKVFCYVKFYCNQNTRDQEFTYVFNLPSGLRYAFELLCFLGWQQLFFKTLCAWHETVLVWKRCLKQMVSWLLSHQWWWLQLSRQQQPWCKSGDTLGCPELYWDLGGHFCMLAALGVSQLLSKLQMGQRTEFELFFFVLFFICYAAVPKGAYASLCCRGAICLLEYKAESVLSTDQQ